MDPEKVEEILRHTRELRAKLQFFGPTALPDPLQRPTWRHERALEIVHGSRASGRGVPASYDDATTRTYVEFLRYVRRLSMQDMGDLGRQMRLSQRYGPLWQAWRLYNEGNEQSSRLLQRHVLEARILSGIGNAEIAQRGLLVPEAVQWYHELFFSVRAGLPQYDWIATAVIGPVIQAGDYPWPTELLLKYFAYMGGSVFLDLILHGVSPEGLAAGVEQGLAGQLDQYIETRLRVQIATYISVSQPRGIEIGDLLAGYKALRELGIREAGAQGNRNIAQESLEVMRQTMKIPLGDEPKLVDGGYLGYTNTKVEPRPAERALLVQGQVPSSLAHYADAEWTLEGQEKVSDNNSQTDQHSDGTPDPQGRGLRTGRKSTRRPS